MKCVRLCCVSGKFSERPGKTSVTYVVAFRILKYS